MEPQTSTTGSLDPQAVALSQAIRQQESGNDPTKKGASGEYGAYQWLPASWDSMSKAAGVNVPLQQATIQQQNQVAYTQIKKWKDEGYNPGQIASMWNAGAGEPNAYQGTFTNGQSSVGTNAEGVKYDVPAYAKSVAQYYQQYKSHPVESQNQQTSSQEGGNKGGAISDILNFAAPIIPDLYNDIKGASTKTISQQLADAGITGLDAAMFIPGLQPEDLAAQAGLRGAEGGASLFGSIAGNAAAGAGLGALGAVSQGNPQGALSGAITGGLLGGGVGAVAPSIGRFLDNLPTRFAQKALKVDPETAQYALESKSIGSLGSLVKQNKGSIKDLGTQIGNILESDKYGTNIGRGASTFQDVANMFPRSEYTADDVYDAAKSLIPQFAKDLDKLKAGTATLAERNAIKSSLDTATKSVYTSLSRPPEVKLLGNALADALRVEVQDTAKETAPLFEQLSKEKNLSVALNKLAKRAETGGGNLLTFRDLLGAGIGQGVAGIPGLLGGVALEKLATTPGGQFLTAKAANAALPIGGLLGNILRTGAYRANQ